MSNENKKLNASQRLEVLETNIQEISAYLNNMARDIAIIKEAIKLLGNKLDATQRAAKVTDTEVTAFMIENNVTELKEKVKGFLTGGYLKPSEAVDENSFLVGKEVNQDGTVVNPRVQFAVGSLKPELREKCMGAKAGDTIIFSEDTLNVEVNEVYAIITPEAEESQAEASPEPSAQA